MLSRRKCLVYCSLALLSAVLSGVCSGAVPKRLDWSLGDIVVEGLGDSLSVSLVWNIKDCNVEASKAVVFVPVGEAVLFQ